MLRLCLTTVLSIIFVGAAYADEDESICAAPLQQALMTVRSSSVGQSGSEASTAWQCSFTFSSHDEAIKAGLSVGTVVYGVPLKVGGTFDHNTVDQWKQQNCSNNARSASFQAATFNYLREVAPGAMNAYVQCIEAHNNTSALSCSLTREPPALVVKCVKWLAKSPAQLQYCTV